MIHTVNPQEAGFSAQRLQNLSRLLQGYIDRSELAGLIALVGRRHQTAYLDTFGMQDMEAGKTMRLDTIFRIASMTKPITAVGAMQLFEQGHFNLNTPVKKFIPGFGDVPVFAGYGDNGEPVFAPLERDLTFRHLFTHTSGLSYGWNADDPVDRLYQEAQQHMEQEQVPPSMENIVNSLATLPLGFQPGSHWRYGYNIDVLGRLVEIISGEPLDTYFQKHIFDPLGMVDTGFFVPPEKEARLSALYGHESDLPQQLKRLEDHTPRQRPVTLWGGGGLVSTIADYARFAAMLANGGEINGVRLLAPKTVELFSLNHAPAEALPYGFVEHDLYHAGYGYSLGTRVLMDVSQTGLPGTEGEFGWDGAFSTYFWVDPWEELYGVLMLQHQPNAYYPIAQQFKQLTYQALMG